MATQQELMEQFRRAQQPPAQPATPAVSQEQLMQQYLRSVTPATEQTPAPTPVETTDPITTQTTEDAEQSTESDQSATTTTSQEDLNSPSVAAQKEEEEKRIAAEEAALREAHRNRGEGESLLDRTIDVLSYPVDMYQRLIGNPFNRLIGLEEVPLASDFLQEQVRETETGFKLEEMSRRTARELMMIPAVPSALTAISMGLYDMAINDAELATMMYNDEGRALLERAESGDEIAAQQFAENPEAFMQPGANFMMAMSEYAEGASGVAQREDGRVPLDEEVGGIIGSMFVGLPIGAVRAASAKLVNMFGDDAVRVATQLASNRTAQIAGRVGEALTPVTVPFTDTAGGYASAVAVNSAAGIGLNDIGRYAMGEDTAIGNLVNMAQDVTPEQAAAGVIAAGGVFAMLRRPSRARSAFEPQPLSDDVDPDLDVGPLPQNSLEQATADAFDADRPAVRVAEMIFGRNSEEVEVTQDMFRLSARQGGDVRINAAWQDGIAPGGPGERYTNSGLEVRTAADEVLSTSQRRMVADGLMAEDILWTMNQSNRGNPSRYSREQLEEMSARMQRAYGDQRTPEIKAMVDMYRTHSREILEQAHKAGMFNAEQMRELRTRPYVPNIPVDDEAGTSLYNRIFGASRERFTNQANSPFMSFREGQVQDFVDPFDALGAYEKSMTKQILENRVRSNYIKMIRRGIRGMSQEQVNKIFPNGVPLRKLRNGEQDGRTISFLEDGVTKSYVVGDPQLRNSLTLSPHSSMQSLSVMRRMYQAGTTGEFSPLFSPISAQLDTFFGALNVKRSQVGGYLDRALHASGMRNTLLGDVASAAVRPIDAASAALIGMGRGVHDRVFHELASQMSRRMLASEMRGTVPPEIMQNIAEMAMRRWHKSMSYEMQRHGYAPGAYSADIGDVQPSKWDDLMRALFDKNLPGRVYRGTLNVIRDGWRTEFFTLNRAKMLAESKEYQNLLKRAKEMDYNPLDKSIPDSTKTPAQLKMDGKIEAATYNINRRAARQARDIGSDVTRSGQSQRVNEVVGAMPYANVGMQSMHAFLKNLAENPMSRWTALSFASWSVVGTGMILSQGEDAGEWWFERVPDNVRARTIPINWTWIAMSSEERANYEFNPDDVMLLDVGPEQAAIKSMVGGGIEYMLGLPHHAGWRDNAFQQRMVEFSEALQQLIPIGTPPVINVGTSAAGYGQTNFGRIIENRGIFNEPQDGAGLALPGDRRFTGANDNGVLMNDRVNDVISSIFGAGVATLTEMYEQVEAEMELNDIGVVEGVGEALESQSFETRQVNLPRVWNRASTPSRSAPVISEAYNIRRAMEPITDQLEIEQFGYVGGRNNPTLRTWPARLADQLSYDPANMPLVQQMQALSIVWDSDAEIGAAFDRLTELRMQYNEVEARRDLPPMELHERLSEITLDIQDAAEIVVNRTQYIEDTIGDGFDLERFSEEVGKALRRAPPRTVN